MSTTLAPLTPAPRPTLSGSARAELLKLSSLTSVRVAIVVTVVAGALGAVIQVGASGGTDAALLGSTVFSSAAVAVIGAIAGSSEYATGTIQPSLMALPHRLAFLSVKTAVMALLGAILLVVSGGVGLGVTASGFSTDEILPLVGAGVYGASIGAFAVGFSMLVRSAAGSVAGILAIVLLVPGLFGGVRIGEHSYLSDLTMSEAGGGLILASDAHAALSQLVILLVWTAVAGVLAALRLTRADA